MNRRVNDSEATCRATRKRSARAVSRADRRRRVRSRRGTLQWTSSRGVLRALCAAVICIYPWSAQSRTRVTLLSPTRYWTSPTSEDRLNSWMERLGREARVTPPCTVIRPRTKVHGRESNRWRWHHRPPWSWSPPILDHARDRARASERGRIAELSMTFKSRPLKSLRDFNPEINIRYNRGSLSVA